VESEANLYTEAQKNLTEKMADLKEIEFPDHLNEHKVPHSDLARMTPEQQAFAKDWNILSNKIDWTMRTTFEVRNILVDHDRLLDAVRKMKWAMGLSFGGGTVGGAVIMYMINYVLKH
jgi:hypothetical protein